jgi:hypothetical protein
LIRLGSTNFRKRLLWLTVGTALGGLAWLLPWSYLQTTKPEIFYILSYTRNTGPTPWKNEAVSDPAAGLKNVSEYPIKIARKCKVTAWTIADNSYTTDVDSTARLRIAQNLIDDSIFNCLTGFVRPPYVRLERGTALSQPLIDTFSLD